MKPSLEKLQKFLKLEAERGYDNRAVVGGLERMLAPWEADARLENIPDELIQVVLERLRSYAGLSPASRAETLEGIWKRIQRYSGQNMAPLPAVPEQIDLPDQPPPRNTTKTSKAETQKSATAQPAVTPIQPRQTNRPARAQAIVEGQPAALNASTTVLQGVGPRHGQTLTRLGLYTLGDMLYYFPRRYVDYSQLKPINRLWYGEEVTVIAQVDSVVSRSIRSGKIQIIEAVVSDGSGALRITWFNQPWLAKRLSKGMFVSLSGKIEQYLGRLVMNNPELEPLDQEHLHTNRIVPVYSLTANITQRWLRNMMNQVVSFWSPRLNDPLPVSVLESANLVDLSTAILQIHFPESFKQLEAARHRLAFDEIFLLQLGVLRQKRAWQTQTARIYPVEPAWLEAQIARLPYTLTSAQQRAIQDICRDLTAGRPMNRLLQGDVGSGKTVVAAMAMSILGLHGAQSAIMAPTAILAEQHYRSLQRLLCTIPETEAGQLAPQDTFQEHEIALLVGATPEAEKQIIREGLATGKIKIVVGTHALIEDPIDFACLQLAVIDEQHRFGVQQRSALRLKGENPHLLVMTATPIPRSLALTVYGDLDLSILDEMPPGRKPVETQVFLPRELERAFSLVRAQVQRGHQAFIIYPLIEESENSSAKSAVVEHGRLQAEIFPDLRLGLLHGRMSADEKDFVMNDFRAGKLDILVSTTVIEVGVDVPNATVMLIEGANRFGLAQLHQLRGRVGRGQEQAYCILVPDSPDDAENERLAAMVETNDGFILAERDLQQRGPGDFLGTRQSGYHQELRLASLTDLALIEKARRHASELFQQDPDLGLPQHQILAAALERFWGDGKGDVS